MNIFSPTYKNLLKKKKIKVILIKNNKNINIVSEQVSQLVLEAIKYFV
jgi:thymidylate kinase